MTLTDLINTIKSIAEQHTLVNTAFDGDIYDNFAEHNIKYGAFNVDIESVERAENHAVVHLYIYYADRLLQSKKNALEIKDDGVNVLQSVINKLKHQKGILNIENNTFNPFEQRFDDYLAGVYANIIVDIKSAVGNCTMEDIEIPKKIVDIDKNGTYNIGDFIINVNIE